MKKYIVVMIALIGVSACKKEIKYIESEPGVEYRVVDKRGGKSLGPNQAMHLDMKSTYKDSVLIHPKPIGGFVVDPIIGVPPMLSQILQTLAEGDSVEIRFKLDKYSLLTRTRITVDMDTTDFIYMNIRVVEINDQDIFTEKIEAELARVAAEQAEKDKELIEAYLAENNLKAERTEDGIYYIINKEGKGAKAKAGETVSVNYTLQLLDGTYIDSSYKTVAEENNIYNPLREPYEPFTFPVGEGVVVKGWDLGVPLVNEGGSALLFIPSNLAYGPEPRPGSPIPANAILKFEIEVMDIQN
ncbi:FKBP-type peptidyl-prolyl cis-trans isomerase [Roseivirga echinicomitans]